MEYYLTIKRNSIPMYATAWINFENKGAHIAQFHLYLKSFKQANLQRQGVYWYISGCLGQGEEGIVGGR